MLAMTGEYQDDKGGGIAGGATQGVDGRGKRSSETTTQDCRLEGHVVVVRPRLCIVITFLVMPSAHVDRVQ